MHACVTNMLCPLLAQMKFTDAMRSKARLSITGSTSENGRVPVAYLRPGLPMSLSITDLSWPGPSQCLTASRHILPTPMKCLSSSPVTNYHSQVCSNHISLGNAGLTLWHLAYKDWTKCPPLTWLSGFSKDLPTNRVNNSASVRIKAGRVQIHEKQSSTVDSFLTLIHSIVAMETSHCIEYQDSDAGIKAITLSGAVDIQ